MTRARIPVRSIGCFVLGLVLAAGAQPSRAFAVDLATLRVAESPKALARASRTLAAQAKRARASAKKLFRADPELRSRILPDGLDPAASRAVEVGNRDGSTSRFILDPLAAAEVGLGRSIDLGRDRRNLLVFYSLVHDRIPPGFRGDLPSPLALASLPLGQVRKAVQKISTILVRDFDVIRQALSETVPVAGFVSPIADCSLEVGWESIPYPAGSADRCDPLEYATRGILRNVDFALRDSLTCVKDQSQRGTCSAHAIVAAAETLAMAGGGVPENLSEQSAYFYAKVAGDWATRYDSGLYVDVGLQAMLTGAFTFSAERDWNYNESPDIGALDPATGQRPQSCNGYPGEMCTDFEFQAVESIQVILGQPYPEYQFPQSAPGGGHSVTTWSRIPDFDSPPGGPLRALRLETAALMVESNLPVVATVLVPVAMLYPDADGYVRHVPGDAAIGAHAITLVGFVANADLPVGVAPDPGVLGGFFVAKNSWDTSWGDCGFFYVSSEFLEEWGASYDVFEVG